MTTYVYDRTGCALMRGDKHVAVRALQNALNRQGGPAGIAVDGDFGPRTHAAVADFQRARPGVVNVTGGVAGELTLKALGVLAEVSDKLKKSPIVRHGAGGTRAPDWRDPLGLKKIFIFGAGDHMEPEFRAPSLAPAFQLIGYEQLLGGRVNQVAGVWTFHDARDPDRVDVRDNECAKLVQAFGVPNTDMWRPGLRVRSATTIPRGTVVATLGDGAYLSDHSGRSHVGIFNDYIVEVEPQLGIAVRTGFTMYDQSNGSNVALRTFKFSDDYDRNKQIIVKMPSDGPGKHDDRRIAVRDRNGKIVGYRVVEKDEYATHKYNRIRVGDEYFIVASNGTVARERI